MPPTVRRLPHPELAEVRLPAVLFALSDTARLELVRKLATEGPLTMAQCQATGRDVPKSTFSHHMKTLREAGLIRSEPDGRKRTITLRRREVDERFPGLLDAVLAEPDDLESAGAGPGVA
jgi:DNA-binding transcriptional ArsR family regulator